MNNKALKVLEYHKIIEMLGQCATCDMSREIIDKLQPVTDIDEIRNELRLTTEGVDLIVHKGPLPLGNIYDIAGSANLARKEGILTIKQLMHIGYNLRVTGDVISFMKGDIEPDVSGIQAIVEVLEPLQKLEEKISRCIVSEDEISDNASPELKNIRRDYSVKNSQIKTKLDKIISSTNNKEILQDAIITMRDGRYVIPVKKAHRDKFPGLVHDQSNTGSTLFIEPQVIVNLNNELRELEIQEKAEIERILKELSGQVAEYYYQIKNNQELLTKLDFIMAKSKLSQNMEGEEPEVNEEKIMDLKEARHPLIPKDKIVPISVTIGKGQDGESQKHRSLIITGPNTGGKTVTLKTIGLLTLMMQSGLHIPAAGTSIMPIFEEVFADIGDEQSIEQNLSTFSSHMQNIVEITKEADFDTLVLLDELGAGTDPDEGAALAISILETLYNKGAITVATTHYNELKKYALQTPGVLNASMEFDIDTLSPTFHLRVGIPGRSNAFEISKKLGLNGNIIQRAESLLKGEEMKFEGVLEAIEQNERQSQKDRTEAESLKMIIKKQEEEIRAKEARLEKNKDKIIEDAKEQARKIIEEAEETTKQVREELRQLSHIESLGKRNQEFDKNRKRLKETKAKYQGSITVEENQKPIALEDVKIGMRVKVLTLDQNGEITAMPDSKGEVQVQIGSMKMNAKPQDLMLIDDGKKKKEKSKSQYGAIYRAKTKGISSQFNVQGKNLDEALMDVEKYLDDAYMSGIEKATIIHGKGEGILSNGIRKWLKSNKHVDSYRKGSINEGGDGVTVITFKK